MKHERMSKLEDTKKSHWSQTFDEKKQQGQLPKFPGNAPQHDKIVLNDDPRRFNSDQEKPTVKPLVGNITTADIDRVAERVKTGDSVDYDTAIVAIIRDAEEEKRELTSIERNAVAKLKIARTKAMLVK